MKIWDIYEKCWIWLSSLQAQGLLSLPLEANKLTFFKAWTCMPGFGAVVVALLLPKSKVQVPIQQSDKRVQSD